MGVKQRLKQGLYRFDPVFDSAYRTLFRGDRGTLRAICLHAVSPSGSSAASTTLPTGLVSTLDDLRVLIESFLKHDYSFITPHNLLTDLAPSKRYVMVTFDDGYFSTHLAVELFKEYNLPLTICVSPYYLMEQKAYWSDAFHRHYRQHHPTLGPDYGQVHAQLRRTTQREREAFLIESYGAAALEPIGDADRPLTLAELKHLHAGGNVEVGNHTMTHAALDALTTSQATEELLEAQRVLASTLGNPPTTIAYPYGYYNNDTAPLCKELGFQIALTTQNTVQSLSDLRSGGLYQVARFGNWGKKRSLDRQLMMMRSNFVFSEAVTSARLRIRSAQS